MSDATTLRRRGLGDESFGGTPGGNPVAGPPRGVNRVAAPAGAREPITVYVNGVEQKRGEDFDITEGQIVFREPIYKENLRELNWFRKLGLGLGLFGWYERNESVDIQFQSSAGVELGS